MSQAAKMPQVLWFIESKTYLQCGRGSGQMVLYEAFCILWGIGILKVLAFFGWLF